MKVKMAVKARLSEMDPSSPTEQREGQTGGGNGRTDGERGDGWTAQNDAITQRINCP